MEIGHFAIRYAVASRRPGSTAVGSRATVSLSGNPGAGEGAPPAVKGVPLRSARSRPLTTVPRLLPQG
jgi:hypothetical protein